VGDREGLVQQPVGDLFDVGGEGVARAQVDGFLVDEWGRHVSRLHKKSRCCFNGVYGRRRLVLNPYARHPGPRDFCEASGVGADMLQRERLFRCMDLSSATISFKEIGTLSLTRPKAYKLRPLGT
jgi:hypothetical protein